MWKVLFLSLFLVGCTSQFDLCIEREKEDYRQRNPKATYGLVQSKMSEFEMSCSQYKGK